MTDVEVLQECRLATMEERALSRQIDRLVMIGGPRGVGGQAIEPAGDRKTNNATAGQLQRLEGLIETLTRKRDENISIILQAERVIERIIQRQDRTLIRYYYVEGLSEYDIATEMGRSQQWANKRRNRILEELASPKRFLPNRKNLLK